MKLDIGCGKNKHEGFVGVDRENFDGVDIIHDLNDYPWPFDDDSVEKILCHNVLEHLESPWDALQEIIKICKDGAKISVRFPVPEHPNAWKDPEHKYTLTPRWFEQFDKVKIVGNTKHYAVPRFGRLGELARLVGFHRFGPDEYRVTLKVVK